MKSILVIETPTNCKECPLCSKDENYWGDIVSAECQMQYKGYLTLNEMEKPYWCPLKDLPSHKEIKGNWKNEVDVWIDGANYGYNNCLDEIVGETE